eukprot:SM000202S05874  [mRNA]  locus=s202:47219:50856:- [translate_table: standard]
MGQCLSGGGGGNKARKTASESVQAVHPLSKGDSDGVASRGSSNKPQSVHGPIKGYPSIPKNLDAMVAKNILGKPFEDVTEHYELQKELGRGLFGVTKVAVDKKTGEVLACKTINKRRLRSDNHEAIKQEAKILAHVSSSPHIAALKATFEDELSVHFVMEICTGGMLYDSITAKGHYSEKQAANILRQIVSIIDYLHGVGVMHRDLKLENFMLATAEENAPLKAIDFGLSTFFEPGQKFRELVGSAYYVAPEVLNRDYGPECDIWSAGVILYMLLCGVPPFWDVSEAGICEAVLRGEVDLSSDPWPTISDSAKDLITRMLEMDPFERITTKQILAHDWVRKDGVASDAPIKCPVWERVRRFVVMNKLKRTAFAFIAEHCLEPDEARQIRKKFEHFDHNQDGQITFEDLLKGLRSVNVDAPEEDIRRIFDAADVDNSGTLNFGEYASTIMVKYMDNTRIQRAFNYFDQDGDGYITMAELQAAMNVDMQPGMLEGLVQEVDTNEDGKIDFKEFTAMMMDGSDGNPNQRLEELYACAPSEKRLPLSLASRLGQSGVGQQMKSIPSMKKLSFQAPQMVDVHS